MRHRRCRGANRRGVVPLRARRVRYVQDRPADQLQRVSGAAAGAGRGLLHRSAEDEGSRAHDLHGRHEAPVRQPAELRLDGALPSGRHLPEDREPDARRQSQVVRDGLALRVPGQRPVQPVQRGPHQRLQHHLRRPRPGSRGHHVRSADGLGLSRHQCALHACSERRRDWERTGWTRSNWQARRSKK